jgi:hypothetical protein
LLNSSIIHAIMLLFNIHRLRSCMVINQDILVLI